MTPHQQSQQLLESQLITNRRHFFARGGMGAAALASLLNPDLASAGPSLATNNGPGYGPGKPGPTHFPARAKRVIYLCQSGAPLTN